MKYDPTKHHRRSIRLKGYDYRNEGAYFVTICTKNRECVLDDPIVTQIILSRSRKRNMDIAKNDISQIEQIFNGMRKHANQLT